MDANSLATRIADYSERPAPTPEAIRAAIRAERLEEVVVGHGPDGKSIRFYQAFQLVFGEKL